MQTALDFFKKTLITSKWNVSAFQFIAIISAFNLFLYHKPLFTFAINNLDAWSFQGVQTLITLMLVPFIFSVVFLFILVCINRNLAKFTFMAITILNAICLYYIDTYKVIFDESMMGNIFNTDSGEVKELITVKVFIYITLLGLFPSLLIYKLNCQKIKFLRLSIQTVATFIGVIVWILLTYQTTLWIDKNGKRLGGLVLPWSFFINGATSEIPKYLTPPEIIALPEINDLKSEKTVVILVIGETARAQNFEYYGYERNTNPQLKQLGAIGLKDTTSCTTYTTASVKCMLTHIKKTSKNFEQLPNYLKRHNIDVWWHSNNWGEKNIEVNSYKKVNELRKDCTLPDNDCQFDEVLMTNVIKNIKQSGKEKTLVILHQSGSHGPSYYKKYPAKFEKFSPVCKSVELNKCTEQELINAYDNTIYYNDHVLASIIKELKQLEGYSSTMIYASDHGESLGESGLYLHGTPKQFAPKVQYEIPFIVWMNDQFKQSHNINEQDLNKRDSHDHQNIFHSVMGAFHLQSDIYKSELDVFSK